MNCILKIACAPELKRQMLLKVMEVQLFPPRAACFVLPDDNRCRVLADRALPQPVFQRGTVEHYAAPVDPNTWESGCVNEYPEGARAFIAK